MATVLSEIKSRDWQISTSGFGIVAEGLADIRQCLDTLLRTTKGSNPLRPLFGSDIFQYVDQPMNRAIPNIIRSILESVQIWEPRVRVHKVTYDIPDDNVSNVIFYITYRLVDQELIDLLELNLGGIFATEDTAGSTLTLHALFPPNPTNKRYQISFTGNGEAVLPAPPGTGFTTLQDLYSWVELNWAGYGRWLQGSDRLILYMNPGIFETGSLEISVIGQLRFEAPIPDLFIGEDYELSFTANGLPASPAPPASFVTMQEMFSWIVANWSAYGQWFINSNPNLPADFLSGDFDSSDFMTGIPSQYLLVLLSETVDTATLTVIAQ